MLAVLCAGCSSPAFDDVGPAVILWRDDIQIGAEPWGFDGVGLEHPIGTAVAPDDLNGANLSRVIDPLLGAGLALRHFAIFDAGGARSQGGIYGDVNTAFGDQARRPEGVWVAQEWYFPAVLTANGDASCWINLWDWHSIDADRGNRWHTSPGLILARDGSMRARWEWGGPAGAINPPSAYSTIALPVGRWFDVEMHYRWDTSPATLSLWIDGQLALQQSGVQTRAPSHQIVETYVKFYGSTQGGTPWSPTPSLRYTRNVRVAGGRIWR
ncbi:MAG TPA: heparin lyase I family protein [Anaeromyxobacteraceae bacterium]|nr:heparin lyase I family protein [Anaeromyxobacteraceae bacterium]